MTTVTIEIVQQRQAELASMIEQLLKPAAESRTIFIAEQSIELRPGEHYAGTVLNADGSFKHDLILMAARLEKRLAWQDAMDWAEEVGGALPDRQEQALLFANCKPHLEPAWHWSSEVHEDDASYAWVCHFLSGSQYADRKRYEGCAVAVRRV